MHLEVRVLALICTERQDEQCHWLNVTERKKRCPSWDSNHISSAIRADVLPVGLEGTTDLSSSVRVYHH